MIYKNMVKYVIALKTKTTKKAIKLFQIIHGIRKQECKFN